MAIFRENDIQQIEECYFSRNATREIESDIECYNDSDMLDYKIHKMYEEGQRRIEELTRETENNIFYGLKQFAMQENKLLYDMSELIDLGYIEGYEIIFDTTNKLEEEHYYSINCYLKNLETGLEERFTCPFYYKDGEVFEQVEKAPKKDIVKRCQDIVDKGFEDMDKYLI